MNEFTLPYNKAKHRAQIARFISHAIEQLKDFKDDNLCNVYIDIAVKAIEELKDQRKEYSDKLNLMQKHLKLMIRKSRRTVKPVSSTNLAADTDCEALLSILEYRKV